MHLSSVSDSITAEDGNSLFLIRQVAKQYNVTLRALRFYETYGLVRPKRVGTVRLYDSASIRQLELVLKGKNLGFSLDEIASMVQPKPGSTGVAVDLHIANDRLLNQINLMHRKRSAIDHAISELEGMRHCIAVDDDGAADEPMPARERNANPERSLCADRG